MASKGVIGSGSIVTVGLAPAWDIICRGKDLGWGLHKDIDEQIIRPAGKALNISRALAWMGHRSTAMGLWGQQDYQQMQMTVWSLRGLVRVKMTTVAGKTRQNVTVVDTAAEREMHLRSKNGLVSAKALRRLRTDLQKIVRKGDVCIFSGAMPGGALLGEAVRLVKACHGVGGRVAVDTYGAALDRIVREDLAWLIKPNVEELRGLLGMRVRDDPASLAAAGRRLLDKVGLVLISRGPKGAVLATKEGAWQGRVASCGKVLSTVGCGDYLLAGFVKGLADGTDMAAALQLAVQVATAHAWGWTETQGWLSVKRCIRVEIERV